MHFSQDVTFLLPFDVLPCHVWLQGQEWVEDVVGVHMFPSWEIFENEDWRLFVVEKLVFDIIGSKVGFFSPVYNHNGGDGECNY